MQIRALNMHHCANDMRQKRVKRSRFRSNKLARAGRQSIGVNMNHRGRTFSVRTW